MVVACGALIVTVRAGSGGCVIVAVGPGTVWRTVTVVVGPGIVTAGPGTDVAAVDASLPPPPIAARRTSREAPAARTGRAASPLVVASRASAAQASPVVS